MSSKVVKLIIFNIFAHEILFEAGRALVMKNWKIYSRKTSMVLTVKAILQLILQHLKNI